MPGVPVEPLPGVPQDEVEELARAALGPLLSQSLAALQGGEDLVLGGNIELVEAASPPADLERREVGQPFAVDRLVAPVGTHQLPIDELDHARPRCAREVVGRRENPIREAIDNSAMAAGLSAIFNVVLDGDGAICGAVYGHPVEAHRAGIPLALGAHTVTLPRRADIVVADGYPFDIEFWQVNKALDNAALAVREGGVIIIVSPCYEGLSVTHGEEIRRIGYRSRTEIVRLVEQGKFTHRVAAVHMIQVAEATIEKGVTCILVTGGIPPGVLREVNLGYAPDPPSALAAAFGIAGEGARVAVLRRASETLPLIQEH